MLSSVISGEERQRRGGWWWCTSRLTPALWNRLSCWLSLFILIFLQSCCVINGTGWTAMIHIDCDNTWCGLSERRRGGDLFNLHVSHKTQFQSITDTFMASGRRSSLQKTWNINIQSQSLPTLTHLVSGSQIIRCLGRRHCLNSYIISGEQQVLDRDQICSCCALELQSLLQSRR